MSRLRILLLVSLTGLALMLMDFFGHPPDNGIIEPARPVPGIPRAQRPDAGRMDSQFKRPQIVDRDARPALAGVVITANPDAGISRIEQVTLSGRVGAEFGEPVAGETVVLYSPSKKLRYTTDTDSYGEYRFTDIEPGWDYVLNLSPRETFETYTRGQIKLSSAREVHDVMLKSIPLGMLIGNIVDPYQRPVAGIELQVTAVEKEYRTTRVVTDANGSFSVADFPRGKFQLAIKGEQSLKATGLNFDPAANLPLTLTVDLGPYHIAGGIYDESGQTFDGADVYLNWALHENGVRIRSTRKVSADSSGAFEFRGLGPGWHELVVSVWRGGSVKKAVKHTLDVGVDSGEVLVVIDTL